MSDSKSNLDLLRELHSTVVLSWSTHANTTRSLSAYNLIMESFLAAQALIDLPAAPYHWGMDDALTVRCLIQRLDRAMAAYAYHYADCCVVSEDDKLPW